MRRIFGLVLFNLFCVSLFAQTGQITGKVTDIKGETIVGATVSIEGTTNGTRTDLDGKFVLRNVKDGKFNLVFSSISYEKKIVSDVEVKKGVSEFLSITLQDATKGIKEVVIKSAAKKESINALLIQQKNMASISDGISGEMIKRSADKNTGDVLKRVSGVTISENKFAVIRGLSDRYNIAMLNGDILPSSEADRKAFSFDIFPSSMLENIVISKAATPDKPAEFAGGIIDLTTKEIPTQNFISLQIGSGINTISTFNKYAESKTSKTDWLGYDHSLRVLPSSFPSTELFQSSNSTFSKAQRFAASKSLENNWGMDDKQSMPANKNCQLSLGYQQKIKKGMSMGVIGALSYNNNYRSYFIDRQDINGSEIMYEYKDTIYKNNVLIGALGNVGFKINDNHKINFKNTFSLNAENQTIQREGDFKTNEQYIKSDAAWFSSNQILTNQLSGNHVITKHKIKIQWSAGQNKIDRSIPDLRKFYSIKNYTDTVYRAYVPMGAASPFYAGTFFAITKEKIQSGKLDIIVPFKIAKTTQTLKVGSYVQQKDRSYDARTLGYKVASIAKYHSDLELLPSNQIFAPENMNENGFVVDDLSKPSDSYTAKSTLKAGYIMMDNLLFEKFRLVYGLRVEDFRQSLLTGNLVKEDLQIEKHNTNVLPSFNFTYLLNKKTNIRVCASQTLSRPEFRELSPSSFYNYNLLLTYNGNPDLEQTKIQNYDIRYEYFMGKGEVISASVFYKYFQNPIELKMPKSSNSLSYINSPDANDYGFELECRKGLGFLTSHEKSILHNFSIYGNFAYIKSSVKVNYPTASGDMIVGKRPMQGQSPYSINLGMTYNDAKANWSTTLLFNRIGERIFAAGDGTYVADLYEAPRNVLDFQLSKKLYNKLEIKFSIADILSNPLIYYYNVNASGVEDKNLSYQSTKDFNYLKQKQGTNFGLSVSYQF